MRLNHFANANKPGKLLARKLEKRRQQQYITQITKDGKNFFTDVKIARQFKEFLKDLYEKDQTKAEDIVIYIAEQKLEKITDDQRELLNHPITLEEIRAVINKLPNNKAPGPDGPTATYYKVLQEELIK